VTGCKVAMSLYHQCWEKVRKDSKQWRAFRKPGHTVVIAGPGSGKTHVLAMKIAYLLREEIIPPQGIACLTYTRMMAKELESRLYALGVSERPNLVVGTVHGFCLGQIVQPFAELFDLELPPLPIRIAPCEVWDWCLSQARQAVCGVEYDPDNDQHFKTEITKYHLQKADIPFDSWENQTFAQILQRHYQLLFEEGYIDFDIIVKRALNLVIQEDTVRQSLYARFPYLAVDEYQDLGYPLYRIVLEIVDHTPTKLLAIGDTNQSIFGFAGTSPEYLRELENRSDMQPTIKLEMNYRSTQEVIDVSNSILPPHANYRSTKNEHGNCRVYECMQVGMSKDQSWYIEKLIGKYRELGIEPEDIAILHPWRQSRDGQEGIYPIANALESKGIDYTLDKHPLYDRRMILIKWLEDLAYWCLVGWDPVRFEAKNQRRVIFEDLIRTWEQIVHSHVFEGEQDSEARLNLTRVLWELQGQDQLLGEWLVAISEALNLESVLTQYARIYPDEVSEFKRLTELTQAGNELGDLILSRFANLLSGVQLTTIHSSKGMEFETVIIAGVERIWADAEGRRLLYVAITRAKREICILYTRVRPEWNPQPPRYINELLTECSNWECFSHYPL